MALSDAAAREIAKVLRKQVGMKALDQIVAELIEIHGEGFPRHDRRRFVHALRIVSD